MSERQKKNLAVYEWQKVANGFRPVGGGLTGSSAISSQILRPQSDDPKSYAVMLTFSGPDATTLRQITQVASGRTSAGNQAPPDAHIAFFIGLTDTDIASWDSTQSSLMRPLSEGGKLLSNPLVLEPITSGQLLIGLGPDLETACSLSAQAA